jgi:sugar lactone lactonase YvrE
VSDSAVVTASADEPPPGADAARAYRALTFGAWLVLAVVAVHVFVLAWDPRLSLLRGSAPLALLLTAIGLREGGLLALVAVAGAAWGYGGYLRALATAAVDPAESPPGRLGQPVPDAGASPFRRGFGGWSIALPVVGLAAVSWAVAWRFGRGFWPAGSWLPIAFSLGATLAVLGRRALGRRLSPSRGEAAGGAWVVRVVLCGLLATLAATLLVALIAALGRLPWKPVWAAVSLALALALSRRVDAAPERPSGGEPMALAGGWRLATRAWLSAPELLFVLLCAAQVSAWLIALYPARGGAVLPWALGAATAAVALLMGRALAAADPGAQCPRAAGRSGGRHPSGGYAVSGRRPVETAVAWAILTLAVVAIVVWLRFAVAPLPVPPPPQPARPTCDLVGADAFAGAEDLEVERDAAGRPVRLWISADDRAHPRAGGGLFQLPLAADGRALDVPRSADMAGRDACSWHPHGMSLVTERDGSRRLYVVNHHDAAADALAATAIWEGAPPCVPATDDTGRALTESIEVYEVRGSTLVFRARWTDELLTRPNDVAALPDGELVVSNLPSGALGLAVETWFASAGSSLARRHPDGRWTVLALPSATGGLRLANGVVAVPAGDGGAMVYAVGRGRGGFPVGAGAVLHALRLDAERQISELRTLFLAPGAADNLSLAADGQALLVAIHEAPYRFALHAEDWLRGRERVEPSPWTVRTVDLHVDGWPGGLHTELRSWATGRCFDAASVGVDAPEGVWAGQVFGRGVLFCPD